MSSVFSTPVLTPLLRWGANLGLRLSGWSVHMDGAPPPPYVLIGAPHTSNWDFALMICSLLHARLDARWLGKTSLFSPPFRRLMQWLGGMPVDRSQPQNQVGTIADAIRKEPHRILCLSPEGTRKKVDRWRTGFYFIAKEACVPIVMVAIDGDTRQVRLLGHLQPAGGDAGLEIKDIQRKFRGIGGLRAENAFELVE